MPDRKNDDARVVAMLNHVRSARRRAVVLTVLVALCLSLSSLAAGQEGETSEASLDTALAQSEIQLSPEEEHLNTVRARLELLEATRSEASLLLDKSKRVTGEDRQLLRFDALRLVDDFEESSSEIVKLLPDLAESAVTDSILTAIQDNFTFQFNLYASAVQRTTRELANLRRQRPKVELAALSEFESQINEERVRYDELLALAAGVVQRSERAGLVHIEQEEALDSTLIERADNLQSRLMVAVQERDRAGTQIAIAKRFNVVDALSAENLRLQAAELRIGGIITSLTKTSRILGARDKENAKYRQAIIQASGEVTEDILDPEVLIGLLRDVGDDVVEWVKESGPTILFRIIVVVLFILGYRLSARLFWFILRIFLQLPRLLRNLITRTLPSVATVVGLVAGLWFLGVDPRTLMTGVGVAGIIIGLALQESLGNIAAGVFILAYRPYDEDDVVQAGGVVGTVREMGLANTMIVTFDNRRLFVPNRKIWSEIIENRSAEEFRRVDTTVHITYEEDIDRALAVIRGVLDEHELVLEAPAPATYVSKLADSWVEIEVRPWAINTNWWPLTTDLPKSLRIGLAQAGIEIAVPRHAVAVTRESPRTDASGGAAAGDPTTSVD